MIQQTREIRGIPLWLLKTYLGELGGSEQEHDTVRGPGWQIYLTQMDDFQIGSIRVGQVKLDLEIEPAIMEAFTLALDQKLLRAGG